MGQPGQEEHGAGQEQDQSVVPHPVNTPHCSLQSQHTRGGRGTPLYYIADFSGVYYTIYYSLGLLPVTGYRQSAVRYFVHLHYYYNCQ